ncbi:unnamed protein product [Discula destructiva]
MTNPLYGLSFFQARKTGHDHSHHHHAHSHLHNRKSSLVHAHAHADFHNRRSDGTADLDPRGTPVTEVVQTISVLQYFDGAGTPLSAQTVLGGTQTDLVDSDTGSTIAVASGAPTVPGTSYTDLVATETGSTLDLNYMVAVTTSSDAGAITNPSAVSSVDPVSLTDASTASAIETSIPGALSLTHILPTTASAALSFSTLSSTSNSTTSSFTSASFTSPTSVPSLYSSSSASTNSSTSEASSSAFTSSLTLLSPSFSSTFASTTFASSLISSTPSPFTSSATTWSGEPSSTGWLSSSDSAAVGGGGSNATPTDAGTSSASPAASGTSSNDTTTQTSKVAGGIVGGIAGVALLVGLAFMILRLRKRGWCHLRLGAGVDEPDAAARQALPAPKAGGGGGGGAGNTEPTSAYGTMQQQRSAPQVITSSLAALAGKRSSRERAGTGSEMAERGFVRVSGKKLPPVLQFGGDGYSDPRENRNSHMSDTSASVYRDSIAVFDQPNHRPLALGSPMRPESGIMVVNRGAARTPVISQAPSSFDSPTLPRSSTFPSTDALGRTLESEALSRETIGKTLAAHDHSRDGTSSRGSHHSRGSTRFTEHVS